MQHCRVPSTLRPLAVAALLALGALHALHQRGIDVPGEVAVIGFDGIEETEFSAPPLSTVDPGREQIARTAIDLLVQRMAPGGSELPRQQVMTDYRVIARESTLGRRPAAATDAR